MPYLISDAVARGTLAARTQPVLAAGPVLRLRPWLAGDVPVLVAAYADPAIQRWHRRSMDETEALAWVEHQPTEWQNEDRGEWAITDANDTVLGRITLRDIHLDEGRAEVGYWVLPAARGQAVASTAVQALTGWAFDELGLQRLDLMHSLHNQASCRVATRTGFVLEGVLRACHLHDDGWHDVHLHGRVRASR
jgi:RimJ/RimL family protein N-acetyltransferase